jgi:hypothetical protein
MRYRPPGVADQSRHVHLVHIHTQQDILPVQPVFHDRTFVVSLLEISCRIRPAGDLDFIVTDVSGSVHFPGKAGPGIFIDHLLRTGEYRRPVIFVLRCACDAESGQDERFEQNNIPGWDYKLLFVPLLMIHDANNLDTIIEEIVADFYLPEWVIAASVGAQVDSLDCAVRNAQDFVQFAAAIGLPAIPINPDKLRPTHFMDAPVFFQTAIATILITAVQAAGNEFFVLTYRMKTPHRGSI